MRTGELCERTGVYFAFCCKSESTLEKDKPVPACPKCGKPTLWAMVRTAWAGKSKRAAWPWRCTITTIR